MTSNIGARQLRDFGQGVGFNTAAKRSEEDGHVKSVIQSALKKAFTPEFLNRIDDVMIFKNLSEKDIEIIIDIELESLYSRTKEMGLVVEVANEAKKYIAQKGYDPEYGARSLSRAIQKYIEDPLAEEIIQSRVAEGDLVQIKFNKKKEEIDIKIKKKNLPIEDNRGEDSKEGGPKG